jgi:hypothetical protein
MAIKGKAGMNTTETIATHAVTLTALTNLPMVKNHTFIFTEYFMDMQQLIDDINELASHMLTVGGKMTYCAGFDEFILHRAGELIGAAGIAYQWADEIQNEYNNKNNVE